MAKTPLYTIIEGYEPFDLLRLSKDAFFEVVQQKFQDIEVKEMKLCFITVEGDDEDEHEVLIEAKVVDYHKKME